MSVVKGKRKESRFESQHHFYALRNEITLLILNDFGFSFKKQEKNRQKFLDSHKNLENIDEIMERWHKKNDSFMRWFIDEEAKAVLDIMRNIEREFTIGNSIYPSQSIARFFEFFQRRKHMDAAIGNCYALKQEINYIIRTLPVDINKYQKFEEEIDKQIALYRGIRKSDNRLLKSKDNEIKNPSVKSIKTIIIEVKNLFEKFIEIDSITES